MRSGGTYERAGHRAKECRVCAYKVWFFDLSHVLSFLVTMTGFVNGVISIGEKGVKLLKRGQTSQELQQEIRTSIALPPGIDEKLFADICNYVLEKLETEKAMAEEPRAEPTVAPVDGEGAKDLI
jgi:hypothetical protein